MSGSTFSGKFGLALSAIAMTVGLVGILIFPFPFD